MTVMEVLVVAAILLLLVGMVGSALRPGLTAWQRSEVRSDLQENALLSMRALTRALGATTGATVTLFPRTAAGPDGGPSRIDAVAMASPLDPTGAARVSDGQAAMQSVCVFWIKTDVGELWMATLDTPDALPPEVGQALQSGLGVPASKGRQTRVGRFLRSLQVDRGAGPEAPCPAGKGSGPFVVVLETAQGDARCHLETAVTPVLESFGGQP